PDAFGAGLVAGRSGIGPISIFDAGALPTRIAGEAELPSDAPLGDRKIAFALEAARQAMKQASSHRKEPLRLGRDAGISMGVGLELFSMPDLVAWRRAAGERDRSLALP